MFFRGMDWFEAWKNARSKIWRHTPFKTHFGHLCCNSADKSRNSRNPWISGSTSLNIFIYCVLYSMYCTSTPRIKYLKWDSLPGQSAYIMQRVLNVNSFSCQTKISRKSYKVTCTVYTPGCVIYTRAMAQNTINSGTRREFNKALREFWWIEGRY